MFTDHFFQKRVQPNPPQLDPLYTHGRTDIQTDGDYIKRVVHGPSGDHTLKSRPSKSFPVRHTSTRTLAVIAVYEGEQTSGEPLHVIVTFARPRNTFRYLSLIDAKAIDLDLQHADRSGRTWITLVSSQLLCNMRIARQTARWSSHEEQGVRSQ